METQYEYMDSSDDLSSIITSLLWLACGTGCLGLMNLVSTFPVAPLPGRSFGFFATIVVVVVMMFYCVLGSWESFW